jgi:hypothetical protein
MTSKKQKTANRANAQKSTGPRSPNGKARAAQNALKHGLTAVTPVLPDEDASAFEELRQRFFAQFQPDTALEIELVEDLTCLLWRLRRVPPIEAGILQATRHQEGIRAVHDALKRAEDWARKRRMSHLPYEELEELEEQFQAAEEESQPELITSAVGFLEDAQGFNMLDKLTRYETRIENRLYRLLRELTRLQDQRVEGEVMAQQDADSAISG